MTTKSENASSAGMLQLLIDNCAIDHEAFKNASGSGMGPGAYLTRMRTIGAIDSADLAVSDHIQKLYWSWVQKENEAMNAPEETTPLQVQEGGDHYKKLAIQPVQYIHANNIGFMEGSIVKYVTRYQDKGGKADLMKARHFIDLLISLEYPNE